MADEQIVDSTVVADDDKAVTEEDLRALKYDNPEVETAPKVEDETEESEEDTDKESEEASESDGQTEADATPGEEDESDSEDATPSFVKEFEYIKGDTPEEYAKNLEIAYKNSTAEAMRLKDIAEATSSSPPIDDDDSTVTTPSDPTTLYMKQKMDEEITTAFTKFSADYPQVNDPADYNKFVSEVATLSQTILTSQGRLATPAELYKKAAAILDWEKQSTVDSKDKLSVALKDNAAASKTTSAPGKAPTKSKVTAAMIETNRKMYPNKTDEEIRKELEPYV